VQRPTCRPNRCVSFLAGTALAASATLSAHADFTFLEQSRSIRAYAYAANTETERDDLQESSAPDFERFDSVVRATIDVPGGFGRGVTEQQSVLEPLRIEGALQTFGSAAGSPDGHGRGEGTSSLRTIFSVDEPTAFEYSISLGIEFSIEPPETANYARISIRRVGGDYLFQDALTGGVNTHESWRTGMLGPGTYEIEAESYFRATSQSESDGYESAARTSFSLLVTCPADFNHDRQADFFDYLDFAQAFAAEDPSADFNGNGQVDFFDYLDFVSAFDIGCE
jgi:hypothetical protein